MGDVTVFFDLDGTLLDVRLRKRVARGRIDTEIFRNELHFSTELRKVIEDPNLLAMDRLFEGARNSLRLLAQSGCQSILYTARQSRPALMRQLDELRILEFFQSVVNTGGNPKTITDLTEYLRPKQRLFYVGDAAEDEGVARDGGMRFFLSELHLLDGPQVDSEKLFFQTVVSQILE